MEEKISICQQTRENADQLWPVIARKLKPGKQTIYIAGGSGTGKSSMARLIQNRLEKMGRKALIIQGDDYPYRVPCANDACREMVYANGKEEALDAYLGSKEELDFDGINELLNAFKKGEPVVTVRKLGRQRDSRTDLDVDVSDTDVLILEWTHALSADLEKSDIAILLEGTPQETLQGRLERGRDAGADSDFVSMVLRLEQAKIDARAEYADIVQARSGEIRKPLLEWKPMLNVYPDSIGGSLSGTAEFLEKEQLKDVFSSLYILPSLYHSDLDRGFCVIDYDLEETLAKKEDLDRIQKQGIDLLLDIVANHASANSPQFQDIVKNGASSPFIDFFIDWNEFWKDQGTLNEQGVIEPNPALIQEMFFRKPGLPVLTAVLEDGTRKTFWNTFYQKIWEENGKAKYLGQIDLNLNSPLVWDYYLQTLEKLAAYGAKTIRLDAFAYTSKLPGRRNFFNDPETWQIIEKMNNLARPLGIQFLPEIHAGKAEGRYIQINEHGYKGYDFFLPGLILDAIEHQSAAHLIEWGQEITHQHLDLVNMLGCHDGIPLLDLQGILSEDQIQDLIQIVTDRGGKVKNLHGAKNIYYQVNASYYSALGEDDEHLLMARAIQMFMPGKPQIWYLDLFKGRNDLEAVRLAGADGHKEINRTNLSMEQIESGLQDPTVQKQIELIHIRNTHPAFNSDAEISFEQNGPVFAIAWKRKNGDFARLQADLQAMKYDISLS